MFASVLPSFFFWQVSVLKLAPAGTTGPLACLFGVFDGHGGDGASKFVANHLHHLVREHKVTHEGSCVQDAERRARTRTDMSGCRRCTMPPGRGPC